MYGLELDNITGTSRVTVGSLAAGLWQQILGLCSYRHLYITRSVKSPG